MTDQKYFRTRQSSASDKAVCVLALNPNRGAYPKGFPGGTSYAEVEELIAEARKDFPDLCSKSIRISQGTHPYFLRKALQIWWWAPRSTIPNTYYATP